MQKIVKDKDAILRFMYEKGSGDVSLRSVVPLELIPTSNGHVLIAAFDMDKEDYRRFYVDQMSSVNYVR